MSANDPGREEQPFKGEVKFKQFTAAVEKALRNFEGLTEWHDLISALARINKVRMTNFMHDLLSNLLYFLFYLKLITSPPICIALGVVIK